MSLSGLTRQSLVYCDIQIPGSSPGMTINIRRLNMILIIDNYDSFTFNVVQALESATKEEIKVVHRYHNSISISSLASSIFRSS